jgi:predicted secreted protein
LAEIKAQFKAYLDKKGLKNIVSNFDTIVFEIDGNRRIIVKALGVIAKVLEEEKSDLILIARGVTGFKPTVDIQTIKLEQQGTYYFTNEERFKKLVEDYPMLKEFAKLVELRAD